MFRGLSSGKFIQLYEVFGTGPLMPDTLATFRALLDQPFPKHWRAKVPQQQAAMPGAHPAAASIASLTLEVRQPVVGSLVLSVSRQMLSAPLPYILPVLPQLKISRSFKT